MSFVDVIGFLAFATNVAGNFMLVYKTIWGWIVRLVSITLWFAYAYNEASLPLIVNAVTFFCINCWGIYKWRKERLKELVAARSSA